MKCEPDPRLAALPSWPAYEAATRRHAVIGHAKPPRWRYQLLATDLYLTMAALADDALRFQVELPGWFKSVMSVHHKWLLSAVDTGVWPG